VKKFIVLFLVLFAFFLSFPHLAYSDLKEEQKKLEEYKMELEKIKKEINNVNITERTAKNLLNNIMDEIDAVSTNMLAIQNKIDVLQNQIDKDKKMIQQKDQDIIQREGQIEASVNLSYKLATISPAELLFTGKDPNTINERIAYLSYISYSSKNVLEEVSNEKNLLEQEKEKLAKSKESLNEFLAEKEKQQEVLREEVMAQNKLIVTLESRKISYTRRKSKIEQEIEKEKALIAKLIREANEAKRILTTGLIWPAKGTITSPFGWRINPLWGGREFHQGIDIAIPTGTKILAVASGSVTYAGWMTGYGNVIILYHGSSISTLYAHLKSFTIRKGEQVKQGQIIAYSDNSGWSTGPHLHFGVYVGDKAVDPLKYLPRP